MNLYRIISATILTVCASAASASLLPDSIIKVNPEGIVVSRSYFAYDNNDYQTMAMHYNLNKKTNQWSGTFCENAVYDSRGNCVKKVTSHWDFDVDRWVEMRCEEYEYDARGRRTAENVKRWNKSKSVWTGVSRHRLEFTDKGLLQSMLTYEWSDEMRDWVEHSFVEYEYDARGRRTMEAHSAWRNDAWQKLTRIQREFDSTTFQQTKETEETWTDGKWTPSVSTFFAYETSGHIGVRTIVKLSRKYNAATAQWVDYERITSELDARATEVYIKREEWDGRWLVTKQERTDTRYDADGNRIYEEHLRWLGDDRWVGVSKVEMKYNEYGDVLSENRMKWDVATNMWKGVSNVVADYDAIGNIIFEQRSKWDVIKQEWQPQAQMSYQYDENRNKVSESNSSWNVRTNKWEEFYKGRFEYAYDAEGNVKQVQEYIWDVKRWRSQGTIFYY